MPRCLHDATLRHLLRTHAPVFPVVVGSAVTEWLEGPSPVLRVDEALLSEAAQDLLITDGLPLASLPAPLHEGFLRAAQGAGSPGPLASPGPRALTPELMARHLRASSLQAWSKRAVEGDALNSMLRFTVGRNRADENPDFATKLSGPGEEFEPSAYRPYQPPVAPTSTQVCVEG